MPRPESLVISPEILGLIAEIDEFKGAWRAFGRLAPERLRTLRKIATVESVGSSTRIEGATLSDREVEALLARAGPYTTRDQQEVAGYAELIDTILANPDAIPITENHIKQLHAILLRHSDNDARHRGEYKKVPNRIEARNEQGQTIGVILETSSPFDTPRAMAELVEWHAAQAGSLHPLLVTAIFIVSFLAIHPFQDGNGRLSRALTMLLLLRAGYAYLPYCSLESIIEQARESYYLALRRTQATLNQDAPDWSPWILYFLRALQQHKRRLESKIDRERLLRDSLPELGARILDLAAEHGQLSVSQIMRLTKAPRGTVKKRLGELEKAGHLQRAGKARGTRYLLP
jgi:Fic family protein